MWRILAIDKVTKRLVEVATATCEAERERILREERANYADVWAVRIPMAAT